MARRSDDAPRSGLFGDIRSSELEISRRVRAAITRRSFDEGETDFGGGAGSMDRICQINVCVKRNVKTSFLLFPADAVFIQSKQINEDDCGNAAIHFRVSHRM